MSYWNYRVVRSKRNDQSLENAEEQQYTIREVFYNDNDEIVCITSNPVYPWGDNIEDIRQSLERMLAACNKQILIEDEIKYSNW